MSGVHLYKHHLEVTGETPFAIEATSFLISALPSGSYNFCLNRIDPKDTADPKVLKAIEGGKPTAVNGWPPCTEFKISGVPSNVTFKIKW